MNAILLSDCSIRVSQYLIFNKHLFLTTQSVIADPILLYSSKSSLNSYCFFFLSISDHNSSLVAAICEQFSPQCSLMTWLQPHEILLKYVVFMAAEVVPITIFNTFHWSFFT